MALNVEEHPAAKAVHRFSTLVFMLATLSEAPATDKLHFELMSLPAAADGTARLWQRSQRSGEAKRPLDTSVAVVDNEDDTGDAEAKTKLDHTREVIENGGLLIIIRPTAIATEKTPFGDEYFMSGAFHAAATGAITVVAIKGGVHSRGVAGLMTSTMICNPL